jgi:hypothetical protein
MLIIKKSILLIINKSLTSLKLYVMIFNKTFKFIGYIALVKQSSHYLLLLLYRSN